MHEDLPDKSLFVSVSIVRLTLPPAEATGSDNHASAEHGELRWVLRSDRREFEVVSGTVVGRGVGVDVQLDDESVSRRHAMFRIVEDAPVVEDLESRNGTLVNGQAIEAPARLTLGDRITVGDYEFELVALPDVADRATQPRRSGAPSLGASLSALSPRERAVFPLLARGLSQREIAAQCGVSVKTVETYRTRISHKLGLRSRAELIRFALETGVLRSRARN
ncbi:MAG TPA: FHA domain-containing protein [Polyangiales bacterium]|jgi:DNA-binding CsgD family transcriptional regulator